MPPTDSAALVPPSPSPMWRVISPVTVAKATALATKFRSSRRDAAITGRELGLLLRDAERGRPGRPPFESRQRLAEYGRLIQECGLSRGTAVNLQYLAAIRAAEWNELMGQKEVPRLTRLYALGHKHKHGQTHAAETDDAEFFDRIGYFPDLIKLLARHEDRSVLLYIATNYVAAACDPPLCPPLQPTRVVTLLRKLGPLRHLVDLVGLLERRARTTIRLDAKARAAAAS